MAYHYSIFSLNQGEANPDKTQLAGSMLGLVFNTIDYTRILALNNKLSGHCTKAGFRPIFHIISNEEEIRQIANHPRTQNLLHKFGDGVGKFIFDTAQQLGVRPHRVDYWEEYPG